MAAVRRPEFVRKFADAVTQDRRLIWALFLINLVGSGYGFYWYKNQLLASPHWQWPIIPDSPGSTFLFTIWLGLLLAGRDWRKPGMQWLAAFAFVSNMKYGLWTAIVLPEAGLKFGWEFDYIHLSLSHGAMWLQAILFIRHYRPQLVPAVGALLYMWFQDVIDYRVLMTFPTLPYMSEFNFARNTALALSTVWGLYLIAQAWFDRRERGVLN